MKIGAPGAVRSAARLALGTAQSAVSGPTTLPVKPATAALANGGLVVKASGSPLPAPKATAGSNPNPTANPEVYRNEVRRAISYVKSAQADVEHAETELKARKEELANAQAENQKPVDAPVRATQNPE